LQEINQREIFAREEGWRQNIKKGELARTFFGARKLRKGEYKPRNKWGRSWILRNDVANQRIRGGEFPQEGRLFEKPVQKRLHRLRSSGPRGKMKDSWVGGLKPVIHNHKVGRKKKRGGECNKPKKREET